MYTASVMLFWFIAAPNAHAYIDPGSGQFIVQMIIGALAGIGLAVATFWRRIRSFFSRKKEPEASPSPDATPSGEASTSGETTTTAGPDNT